MRRMHALGAVARTVCSMARLRSQGMGPLLHAHVGVANIYPASPPTEDHHCRHSFLWATLGFQKPMLCCREWRVELFVESRVNHPILVSDMIKIRCPSNKRKLSYLHFANEEHSAPSWVFMPRTSRRPVGKPRSVGSSFCQP